MNGVGQSLEKLTTKIGLRKMRFTYDDIYRI